MRLTWGAPGSCRAQMGPMLAPWTLLSGMLLWMGWCTNTVCITGRGVVALPSTCRPTLAEWSFLAYLAFYCREMLKLRSWWRHQMEKISALLAICAENSPVPAEFPAQRPVARCFDVFIHLRLNKRLNKQSWGWWFETLSPPLWRHCNAKQWYIFHGQFIILPWIYTWC